MIDMNKIGNYIKKKGKKAGLTQEEFAMRSGLGLRFCKRIRTGKGNCAYGQSKSGIGNVRERSCTGRKGGITSGVRI